MKFNLSSLLSVLKKTPAEAIKVGSVVVGVLQKNPALVPEIIAVATSGNVAGALASNPKVVTDVLGAVFAEVQADPAVLGALVAILEPSA